ncbi:hypothetical protein FOZ63_032244, partial [Perkinsus olseni]
RVLRYLLELPSVKKLLRHFDPDSVEHVRRLRLVLLEIELMVNQRPLGLVDTGAEVRTISPDSLCYGYARRTDQVADPGIAIFTSPNDEVDDDDGDVDGILGSVSPYTSRPGYLKDRSDKAIARGAPQSSVMPLFGKDDLVFVRAGRDGVIRRVSVRNVKMNNVSVVSHHNVVKSFLESELELGTVYVSGPQGHQ